MAQDDYYYEIQLTNKQLVFYFMAGATGLILSFLAGVMVGRGVDSAAGEVQAARTTIQEDRIVAEETPKPVKPAAEDLTYAQRLEGDKVDDSLEKPRPAAAAAKPAPKPGPAFTKVTSAPVKPAPAAAASVKPGPGGPVAGPAAPPARVAANVPAPAPAAAAPAAAAPAEATGGFTIQVGVFKEKARADAIVTRLRGKGFAPGVSGGAEGPFSVRVGHYADRAAADRDVARLRDEEKLQPFVVKR